jgi:hypothetical protein
VNEFFNWDCHGALDFPKLKTAILAATQRAEIVIVEGFLLFETLEMLALFHCGILLKIGKETCRERRFLRDEWIRQNWSYFEEFVWPEHQQYLTRLEEHCQQLKFQLHHVEAEKSFEEVAAQVLGIVVTHTGLSPRQGNKKE